MTHERDYLERTIATVRNHREADNCWPQWANIFADEIERLWAEHDEIERRSVLEGERRIAALEAKAEALVGALREITTGEWDDLDPDDGLHQSSVRAFARDALADWDAEQCVSEEAAAGYRDDRKVELWRVRL